MHVYLFLLIFFTGDEPRTWINETPSGITNVARADDEIFEYISLTSHYQDAWYLQLAFRENGKILAGENELPTSYCSPRTGWVCLIDRRFLFAYPLTEEGSKNEWTFCDWTFESKSNVELSVLGSEINATPIVAKRDADVVLYWYSKENGIIAFTLDAEKNFSNTVFTTSGEGVLSQRHLKALNGEYLTQEMGDRLVTDLTYGDDKTLVSAPACDFAPVPTL